jgi:ethanolamine utilization protein EutP (predicted NTPase)
LTLGFKEITEKTKTKPEDLERIIAGMIAEGLVNARIDLKNQTVEFTESDATGQFTSNAETVQLIMALESQNQRIVQLMRKADSLDKKIKLSPEYVTIQVKKELSESKQDVSGIDADMAF